MTSKSILLSTCLIQRQKVTADYIALLAEKNRKRRKKEKRVLHPLCVLFEVYVAEFRAGKEVYKMGGPRRVDFRLTVRGDTFTAMEVTESVVAITVTISVGTEFALTLAVLVLAVSVSLPPPP